MKRIAIRLLAFNLLLVFLPVAGVLYLGAYEARLESAEIRSMTEQARIAAAAIGRDAALNPIDVDELLARTRSDVRFRVLDPSGRVIADSRPIPPAPPTSHGSPRHNTLYRVVVFVDWAFQYLFYRPASPIIVATPRGPADEAEPRKSAFPGGAWERELLYLVAQKPA